MIPFMRWRTLWKEQELHFRLVKCKMPIQPLRRNIKVAAETMNLKFGGECEQKISFD